MRLLLVEDDEMMGAAVKIALEQALHAVDWVQSGEDAEHVLPVAPYDAVVLDINLPGISGLDVLRNARMAQIDVPVLLLTSRDETKQKIEGLNAGADDYLVKPFDLDELLARLNALSRRSKGRSRTTVHHKGVICDFEAKTVSKGGKPVDLSAREFVLVSILMENIGKILSKRQLEDKLYGWDCEIESNAIEAHVSYVRKKIGNDFIRTIRGLGYIVE